MRLMLTGPFSTGEIAQLAAQARISATAGQVSYRRPCWPQSTYVGHPLACSGFRVSLQGVQGT